MKDSGPTIKIGDIKESDKDYLLRCICSALDCSQILAETHPMTGKELYADWTGLIVTAGFNTMACPDGHRPTFSDLNISTEKVIVEAQEQQ